MRAARVSSSKQARISSSSSCAQYGKEVRSLPLSRGMTTRSSSTAAVPRASTASVPKTWVDSGSSLATRLALPASTAPLKASSIEALVSVRVEARGFANSWTRKGGNWGVDLVLASHSRASSDATTEESE